ncbi:hypothetical protein FisN_6Hh429 [Fistulifera solaris]|uniref:Rab-GAP TBC domain-containing protein n=1 Tax=Fistulifera solaris TaxID=1519565 RepID=A0A1Z5K5N8_FISSO|nr:hypothetical protein FisN_6Hh429 [Fistulifera solaris]|eukprot:GAX21539.1 hypothetical protein FisN_6Hh429 [Fistulifera solaris]
MIDAEDTSFEWSLDEAKYTSIKRCLESDVVNLWKLREMAWDKGGLLCPQLRQRAWPILFQCHTSFRSTPEPLAVDVASKNLAQLQYDTTKVVWNIQEHLLASQRASKQLDTELLCAKSRRRRRVTFMDDADSLDFFSPGSKGPRVSPTSSLDSRSNSPTSIGPDDELSLDDRSILSRGTVLPGVRPPTAQEQLVLYNAVAALLRTPGEPHTHYEDDNYYVFRGLVDLAALFMINIESPSLASLLLKRVSVWHLRDALRRDHSVANTALSAGLGVLLQAVEPSLYQTGVYHQSSLIHTMTSWFTRDIMDVRVVSRVLDVLLVSHPVTVIYLMASILHHSRAQILETGWRREWVAETVTEDTVESIIKKALQYMRACPILDLVQATRRVVENPDAVVMLEETLPAIPASTLSDFAVWKVKESDELACEAEVHPSFYPAASLAMGLPLPANRSKWVLFLLCVMVALIRVEPCIVFYQIIP